MSLIKGKDTKPEIILRSMLHRSGFRFRLHDKKLPGKPDIVLPRYNTVIFINGCFWHRHENCKYAYTPKSRQDFWNKKFQATLLRDTKKEKQLKDAGWNVVTIWECEIKKQPDNVLDELTDKLIN
ncbi:T/G mismatch-specific endonuclease [Nitrosomonas aestuarii]|uniref:T/G mismatch-specific endonuclease n=2 Tax=Nitrosomonas aestuarii TaxID=52441 RepID=A0A1I4B9R8_9PROT|nr:T/G mismatch-specific endonuclease [Nitrosomonas aestuarii]